MKIQTGYVVEVGLEASRTTETLLSTVKVVAEHDRQSVGVIGHSGGGRRRRRRRRRERERENE